MMAPIEAAVVHHTGCGTGFLADAAFRSAFAARTGLDETELAAEAVVDPAATVLADVERLLSSPKPLPQISVSGHVYDLQTGLVTTIIGPAQPRRARSPAADGPGTWPEPDLAEFHLKLAAAGQAGLAGPLGIVDAQRREVLQRLRDAQRTAMGEPDRSPSVLLLEGIVLRLQADLRWLETCERALTERTTSR
jgi:hypothetical protein